MCRSLFRLKHLLVKCNITRYYYANNRIIFIIFIFFQIMFHFIFFHKFCFFHFCLMEWLFFLNATMGGCGALFSLFFTRAVDPSIRHSKYYVTYFLLPCALVPQTEVQCVTFCSPAVRTACVVSGQRRYCQVTTFCPVTITIPLLARTVT